jgi:hypothetical protein
MLEPKQQDSIIGAHIASEMGHLQALATLAGVVVGMGVVRTGSRGLGREGVEESMVVVVRATSAGQCQCKT